MRKLFALLIELWRTRHTIEVGDKVPYGMNYTEYEERKAKARLKAMRYSDDA